MAVINTNYLALVSQNNLNKSQSSLGQAIERLSSGLRINSAKDDAAGQAIANRFTANIKGLTQAARNSNDGISIAQTTEGALTEINNNLQRIRELSVQAANGTNSHSDLESIQAEINQRLGEIDRVSDQTQFNGVKVLAQSQSLTIQVGANDDETISIDLKQINSDKLGLGSFNISGPAGTPGAVGSAALKDVFGETTKVASTSVTASASIVSNGVKSALGLTVGSTAVALTTTAVVDDNGNWFAEIKITAVGDDINALKDQGFEVSSSGAAVAYIALDPTTDNVGTGSTAAKFTLTAEDITAKNLKSSSTQDPLAGLDKALAQVDSLRSDLGAIQNRFESTIANLNNTINNLSAARSRIEDADYAVEVSNMTRAQILQQAGTAVLAQANQVPQTMLSLLS